MIVATKATCGRVGSIYALSSAEAMTGLYASAYPCVGTMANGAFPCASKGKELACFSRVLKVSGREIGKSGPFSLFPIRQWKARGWVVSIPIGKSGPFSLPGIAGGGARAREGFNPHREVRPF